jgi:hypothetical protein
MIRRMVRAQRPHSALQQAPVDLMVPRAVRSVATDRT